MLYKIIDDVLPKEMFLKLKNIVERQDFPWMWIENTAYTDKPEYNPSLNLDYSFTHMIFYNNKHTSNHSLAFLEAYDYIFDKYEFKDANLIRSRLGLITSRESEYVHGVHIDYKTPHYTMLLYFNNGEDGETHFYNHMYDRNSDIYDDHHQYLEKKEEFEVLEKVKPKENRAVFFNGHIYHSSSSPLTSSRRIANNVNFTATRNNMGLDYL